MKEKKKPDNLEIEKIKLERLKVYGKIITVLISIGIGTFGVTVINSKLQEKQLDQQTLINNATLQQAEMENLGKFLEHALKKDTNERIRFATYFAKVTIDQKARYRWSEYLKSLKTLQADTMRIKEQLIAAQKAGDIQHGKELESELANLRRQMAPSPKDNEYITSQKAEDYLILGNDLYSKSNNEESLNNYDEAIKLNPDSDEVWVSKGVVLEDMNRYEDALKAYEKAIELNNNNADAWIGKGVTLCHLNSYDKAIEANNKAIELKPDLAKGWYNLACIYSIKGKKEDALVKLKKAIKLDEYNKVMAQRDDDFKNIREDKKFQDLLNNM